MSRAVRRNFQEPDFSDKCIVQQSDLSVLRAGVSASAFK